MRVSRDAGLNFQPRDRSASSPSAAARETDFSLVFKVRL